MKERQIFLEVQAQLKYFDSRLDPLSKKYPENRILEAIQCFLGIINKDFQLRCTYCNPIENFSKRQFADVDFYLVGQNLEYCVAAIIHYFQLEKLAYKNFSGKSYKTLRDHLQLLVELQKAGCLSYPTQSNISKHLIGYRNAIAHEAISPSNINVRKEYIRGTFGAIILIIYYISLFSSKGPNNGNQGGCGKETSKEKKTDIQSLLDSFI